LDTLAADPEELLFIVVARDGQPIAICPLERRSRSLGGLRIRVLRLPRDPHLTLGDVIASDGAPLSFGAELLRFLDATPDLRPDCVLVENVLAESFAAKAFVPQGGFAGETETVSASSHIPLRPYDEMFAHFKKKHRHNLRRFRKRVAQLGDVHYVCASHAVELGEAYQEFLKLEAAGWKGQQGSKTAIQVSPRHTEFYQKLAERFSESEGCEIHRLCHAEKTIAALFVLVVDDWMHALKITYDEDYSDVAPGNMLLEHILRNCDERPALRWFSFVSAMEWQKKWAPISEDVVDVRLYRRSMRGRLAAAADRTKRISAETVRAAVRLLFRRIRGKIVYHPFFKRNVRTH
jgi:CelD/BcsL family acetyltransferase involved in cellulose biosynthesis